MEVNKKQETSSNEQIEKIIQELEKEIELLKDEANYKQLYLQQLINEIENK